MEVRLKLLGAQKCNYVRFYTALFTLLQVAAYGILYTQYVIRSTSQYWQNSDSHLRLGWLWNQFCRLPRMLQQIAAKLD